MTVRHKIECYLRTFLFFSNEMLCWYLMNPLSVESDQLKRAPYNVDTTVRNDYKIFSDGLDESTNFSKLS